jgi:hypothetical protein
MFDVQCSMFISFFSTKPDARHRRQCLSVEISHQPGMPFSRGLAFGTRLPEVKAFGDALGYAGRFQSLINPVHAVVALDGFAGIRIPLGCAPRAGRNTRLAAHAKFIIDEDDTVRGPFLHRAGRTGGDTPGVLAVEAGHKYIGHARQVVDFSGTDGNYLAQSRPDGQIIFRFTVRFAAVASNAAFRILVDVILAHMVSSKL